MRIGKYVIHVHPISVHFTNALFPVSLLFLALYLFTGDESYRTTYGYIIGLAALSAPISYLTGYTEWRQKYRAARVRVFNRKLQMGLVLMSVGAACALWYWADNDILARGGIATALFAALNFAALPLVLYLGYLGGRLVRWQPH